MQETTASSKRGLSLLSDDIARLNHQVTAIAAFSEGRGRDEAAASTMVLTSIQDSRLLITELKDQGNISKQPGRYAQAQSRINLFREAVGWEFPGIKETVESGHLVLKSRHEMTRVIIGIMDVAAAKLENRYAVYRWCRKDSD